MRLLCLLLVVLSVTAAAGQAAPPAGPVPKVSVDLKDAALRDGIRMLFEGTGLQYSIEPSVPNVPVSLSVQDVPAPAALRLLLRQAAASVSGLTFSRDGKVYVIRVRRAEAEPGPRSGVVLAADEGERKVTLNFRDTPLRDAINILFTGSGLQYAVDPNVPNVPVNLNVREITVQQALRLVIKQAAATAPGLTYSRDGDVYLIRMRPPAPPIVEMPPPEQVAASELVWEKVPLQFVDVGTVTRAVGGQLLPASKLPGAVAADGIPALPPGVPGSAPIPPPASPAPLGGGAPNGPPALVVPEGITAIVGIRADNSLLVRGTPEDIQSLKQILRLIDIPSRQIRVRISAGPLAAEGLVMNGASLRLADGAGGDRLSAQVTGRVNGDGSIDLTVDGTVSVGGASRPLSTRVRVPAGQATQLVTAGQGSRQVRVWARASIEPER